MQLTHAVIAHQLNKICLRPGEIGIQPGGVRIDLCSAPRQRLQIRLEETSHEAIAFLS